MKQTTLLILAIILIILPIVLIAQQSEELYYTGAGGSGMTLAILPTEGGNLDPNLLAIIQGTLVSVVQRYSAITVTDRVTLDMLIAESLNAIYSDNSQVVRLGHVQHAQYWLFSKLTRTSASSTLYNFQITITDFVANPPQVKASYSGNCNISQLEDHSAIHRASKDVLASMGVQLTARANTELDATVTQNQIAAQQNNARGYQAQRRGNEVAALNYYFQAAEIDPSLFEAVNRSNVMFTNVSTGNIGADARNDLHWRDEWEKRLKEIEVLYYDLLRNADPPFTLFYATDIKREGETNYNNRTMTLKFSANMRANGKYFSTAIRAMERVTQSYYDGLVATKRANTWGFGDWPNRGLTQNNPFNRQWNYPFNINFELLNAQGRVVGSKTQDMSRSFIVAKTSYNRIWTTFDTNRFESVVVSNVSVDYYTDERTTIRIANINGLTPQQAKISTFAMSEAEFNTSRGYQSHIVNGVLIRDNAGTGQQTGQPIFSSEIMIWNEPVRNFFNKIGDNVFAYSKYSSVTIPSGVTYIGDNAFYKGSNLTRVTIPVGVTYIGKGAFYECRNLTSIAIPGSVTHIGDSAFLGCSSLTSVTISDGVTHIGEKTFSECRSLTSITIPGSVTHIGDSAFLGCSSLTSVTISDGVTHIGDSAFYQCNNMTNVTIPGSVTHIGDHAFRGCSGLTSVIIPDGVTHIGEAAFYECSGLTSIYIPNNVKEIKSYAFPNSIVIYTGFSKKPDGWHKDWSKNGVKKVVWGASSAP